MATQLDPSIILAGGEINDPSRMLTLQELALKMKGQQQQVQSQNMLKQIFSNPKSYDAQTGKIAPEALRGVLAADPKTGMDLMQDQAQLADSRLKRQGAIQDMIAPVRDSALEAYDAAIKGGASPEAAQSAGQKALEEGIAPLKTGGALSDDEQAQLATKFDPAQFRARALSYKDMQALNEKEKADDRADKRESRMEGHEERMEGLAERRLDMVVDKTKAQSEASFTPDELDLYADQILSGDKSPLQNMGRGNQGSANLVALRKAVADKARAQGKSGADLAAIDAEFGGTQAGEKELGSRTAKVGMAVDEANRFTELSREAYAKLPRGSFVPFNKLTQLWETNNSSPEQAAAYAADNSLINAYARAVSPTGTPTVSDKDHAREMLSTAQGPEAHEAVINQLQREMQAAINAPKDVKAELREGVTGKTPDKKADGAGGHAVGDVIIQGGKRYKATAVKDGKVTSAEEIQ